MINNRAGSHVGFWNRSAGPLLALHGCSSFAADDPWRTRDRSACRHFAKDLVLDPFGGSGTTLMAAEATGRSAAIVEPSVGCREKSCRYVADNWRDTAGANLTSPKPRPMRREPPLFGQLGELIFQSSLSSARGPQTSAQPLKIAAMDTQLAEPPPDQRDPVVDLRECVGLA